MKRIFISIAVASIFLASCEKAPVVQEHQFGDSIDLTVDALRPVLKEFYDATGGPDWAEQPNWMEEDDMDNWTGFSIDQDEGIVELYLPENGLKGTLPASLASLPLQYLDLSDNELTGNLPSKLGDDGCLIDLDISNNDFTGNLPTSLAHSRIEGLYAKGNRFEGEIPAAIKAMPYYRDFVSFLNPQQEGFGFTGIEVVEPDLDDVRILKDFFKLQSESFRSEYKWDQKQAEDWAGVKWGGDGLCRGLDLAGKELVGTRDLLKSLTTLTILDLNHCAIDEILDLSNMKELIYLDLCQNSLYQFPEGLGQLTNLQLLDLSGNDIKSEIPASLNNLRELRYLGLAGNQLYGKAPMLDQLTKLRLLALDENEKFDVQPLPEWIGNCRDLAFLYLPKYTFIGSIPESWKNLTNLNELIMLKNYLSGEIRNIFKKMTNLTYLDVSDNQFSGNLPEFSENNRLTSLYLESNKFTGTIPENWTVLKGIHYLFVRDNELTGTVPEFFLGLEKLAFLDVQYNQMAGTMPQSLMNHPYLGSWNYENQKNGKLTFAETALTAVKPMLFATSSKHVKRTTGQASEDCKAALKAELFPSK